MARIPQTIQERRAFIDTSAFLAILDANDRNHPQAETVIDRLAEGRYFLFTTLYTVVEAHASILGALGRQEALKFLQLGLQGIQLLRPKGVDEERGRAIIAQYEDKDYSLCDAVGFAVMERRGCRLAFAFDGHFRQHGFSTPLDQDLWP